MYGVFMYVFGLSETMFGSMLVNVWFDVSSISKARLSRIDTTTLRWLLAKILLTKKGGLQRQTSQPLSPAKLRLNRPKHEDGG